MEDVNETTDEGQRPHEALNTCTSRDTPLKRNALASKQRATYRGGKKNSSKASSPRRKSGALSASQNQSLQQAKMLKIESRGKKEPQDEERKTPQKDKNATQMIEASPAETQFAQNPYMDLRTKPSDAPNNFFSLLTQNSVLQENDKKSRPANTVNP